VRGVPSVGGVERAVVGLSGGGAEPRVVQPSAGDRSASGEAGAIAFAVVSKMPVIS
jgi:hypothetical protein